MKKLSLFFIVCLFTSCLFGQQKYEKEYRIQVDEVPLNAINFVDSMGFQKRVKWYMEESLTGKSIEAKSKKQRQKYSIEFDTLGQLEDVEIEIHWNKLPKSLQNNIEQNLKKDFTKIKIIKVQKQFTGNERNILAHLSNKPTINHPEIKYEIILEGVSDGVINWYEYTFTTTGEAENWSIIVFRNIDNLEF